ncbi:MAG: DUF131 domain-containing protein [Crenarchaeota archaeon]|jgi:uncharacterized membrane protein|nr:DUF131 domain-containing protein [Thermoproteota archaeon]
MLGKQDEANIRISSRMFSLVIFGIVLVFIGTFIIIVASLVLGGSGNVGGIIMIGPIPIVFGAGPNTTYLIVIGAVLSIISVILFIVTNRRTRLKEEV